MVVRYCCGAHNVKQRCLRNRLPLACELLRFGDGEFSKMAKGPIPVSGYFLVSGLVEDALSAFAFPLGTWGGRRVEGGLFWMGVTDIFVTGDYERRTRSMVLRIERRWRWSMGGNV